MTAPRKAAHASSIVLIAAALLCFPIGSARALDDAAQIQLGKTEYMGQCAACHGPSGKGDGPVAEVLHPKPSNLTQLTKEFSGKFPRDHALRVIDGRKLLNPHGDLRMPVWGHRYQAAAAKMAGQVPHDVNTQALVFGRITALVKYLESIQAD